MSVLLQLVVFCLDGQRHALPMAAVERIVRAVEVTPLPGAPAVVLGAVNVRGRIFPVLSLRQRFGLPEREIRITDQFVIAQTLRRTVVLPVDEALDVIERPESAVVRPDGIVPGLDLLQGVVKLDDGLILIHDLDKFLSLDEAHALDAAMSKEATDGA